MSEHPFSRKGATKVSPDMQMPVKVNTVAKGRGVSTQKGNRRGMDEATTSNRIKAGKQPEVPMRVHQVAKGKPSAFGNRSKIFNGSTDRGESQVVGTRTKGGVGTPARFLGLSEGAIKSVRVHGQEKVKGNRFDLYQAARGK